MPKYKQSLGRKPPKLSKPRPGQQQLYCSFDPITLQRDCPTGFYFHEEKQAQRWLDDRWKRANQERKAKSLGRPLTATFEDCMERAKNRAVKVRGGRPMSPKTVKAYADACDIFLEWTHHYYPQLKPLRIGAITRDLVADYIDHRMMNALPDRENRELPGETTMHRNVMGIMWALKTGAPKAQLTDDHYALLPKGMSGKSQSRTIYLNADEIKRLFQSIDIPSLRAMVVLAALTGCRRNDTLGVREESFGKKDGWDYIRFVGASKGRDRKALLLPEVLEHIERWVKPALPIELPWKHGTDSIYHTLEKACTDAGLPQARPNDLRSSFSVLLLDAGHSRDLVARIMGTSVQMLNQHYDRARGEDADFRRQQALASGKNTEILPKDFALQEVGEAS